MAWSDGAYAGFWQRVAGTIVDSLLLMAAAMLLMVVVFAVVGGVAAGGDEAEAEALAGGAALLVALALLVGYFLYDTLMTSRTGATLGKRAAGIEVRTASGDLPSFGRCTGRFFARYLSGLPLSLGYLWVLWDPQRQTWHDKLCGTVVLKRETLVPVGSWSFQPLSGWDAAATAPGSGTSPATPSASPYALPSTDVASGPYARPGPGEEERPGPVRPEGRGVGEIPGAGAGAAGRGGVHGETMETATWGRPAAAPRPAPHDGPADGARADGARADDDGLPAGAATERPEADQRTTPAGGGPPPASGGFAPMADRPDPNTIAIDRAQLVPDAAVWLRQIAGQVDARLDRVSATWRTSPQAEAARACAFGILLGHLARLHPHMAGDLGKVAEAHPSFSTLLEGSRLATLVEIAAEPGRATAWLGPLIDVTDRERVTRLLA